MGLRASRKDSDASASAIDRLSREADALAVTEARRRDGLNRLLLDIAAAASLPPAAEVDASIAKASAAAADVARLRAALNDAQKQLAEARRLRLEVASQREELRTLAQLALRHLGETCPVCGQAFDHDATIHRLSEIAAGGDVSVQKAADDTGHAVSLLSDQLSAAQALLTSSTAEMRAAEIAVQVAKEQQGRVLQRASELGVPSEGIAQLAIQAQLRKSEQRILQLRELQAAAESIAVRIGAIADQARRRELLHDRDDSRQRLQEADTELARRDETGRTATKLIDALRESTSDLVTTQLTALEPLVQRVYGRIDPHPVFKSVRLITWMRAGRGRLSAEVADLVTDVKSSSPAMLLSSSQTNALAVAIFLALNLGLPTRPLDAVMLDDPLQSLDDVNLLGLIDLLRRTKQQRQLLISTHDDRFGQLLGRKLRPVERNGRTVIHRFFDWGRRGPNITSTYIPQDAEVYRLVGRTA